MKKLLLMFIACGFTTLAQAQKITEKDLQGDWKLISFNASGIKVDVIKEDVSFSDEVKKQIPPEAQEQVKIGMQQSMADFKAAHTLFKGNNITQTMGTKVSTGTFTIKDEGSYQLLLINDGGGEDDVMIYIKDNQLHFVQQDDKQMVDFIYAK